MVNKMKTLATIAASFLIVSSTMSAVQNPVSGSWSLCGGSKQRQGWCTNGTPLTTVVVKWSNTTVTAASMMWGGAPKLGSAVTDNARLYVSVNSVAANTDANLLALDLSTGNNLWTRQISSIYAIGTPVVTDDRVYANELNDAGGGMVACIDKTNGNVIWTNAVDNLVGGAMLVHDDKVIFGSKWSNAGLHCFDAHGGTSLWINTDGTSGGEGVSFWTDTGAALSLDGASVYFRASNNSGKIVAADVTTGTTIWTRTFSTVEHSEGCQPVVDDAGDIYSGFDGQSSGTDPDIVVKFSPSGSTLWTYTFSGDVWGQRGAFALSPDNATLYCCSAATGITALNSADGTKKWDANCGESYGGCVVGAPSNIVISVFGVGGVATARGVRDNGASATVLWSIPLSPYTGWLNASGSSPALLNNGDVIVETAGGVIACITYCSVVSPTNKLTLSWSPWYAGSIQVSPPGEWFYTNEAVTLTAVANPGHAFTNWSGDVSGVANPIVVTMSAPRMVQADFTTVPIAVPDSNVWETFDSPHWADHTWYGPAPDSHTRRLYYTNFGGRTCLAYHRINSGSNAQLHTDFGLFPYECSNTPTIVLEMWTPDLGQPYTVRTEIKTDFDNHNAGTAVVVNTEGWKTFAAPLDFPDEAISLYWVAIGGFPSDTHYLPAGKTTTFYLDKFYATGPGGNVLIDDFNDNPTWVGNGNWRNRPRDWRYDTDSDFSPHPYDETRNYHPLSVDPIGVHTGLCLVLPFEAGVSTESYAKVENADTLYADLSCAVVIEADVRVTASNTPVGFTFYDSTAGTGDETKATAYQTAPPGSWQRLSWSLPPQVGSFHWENVEKLGVMVRTEGGDASEGALYLDNISFLIPEPASVTLVMLAACVLVRRK